ncbi:unnamed protein product [Leuciscus chuanchicus]
MSKPVPSSIVTCDRRTSLPRRPCAAHAQERQQHDSRERNGVVEECEWSDIRHVWSSV